MPVRLHAEAPPARPRGGSGPLGAPMRRQARWSAAAGTPSMFAIRSAVVAYARRTGWANRADDVSIAVGEALANVVVHAYAGRAPGDVTVRAESSAHELTLTVQDDGAGLVRRPNRTGLGLGFALMTLVADRFTARERRAGGTEIVLRFRPSALA